MVVLSPDYRHWLNQYHCVRLAMNLIWTSPRLKLAIFKLLAIHPFIYLTHRTNNVIRHWMHLFDMYTREYNNAFILMHLVDGTHFISLCILWESNPITETLSVPLLEVHYYLTLQLCNLLNRTAILKTVHKFVGICKQMLVVYYVISHLSCINVLASRRNEIKSCFHGLLH